LGGRRRVSGTRKGKEKNRQRLRKINTRRRARQRDGGRKAKRRLANAYIRSAHEARQRRLANAYIRSTHDEELGKETQDERQREDSPTLT